MRFPLTQGAYVTSRMIANAQTCVNLYAEPNPKDAPFEVTHYEAPGLDLVTDATALGGICRGVYWASNGRFYAVFGSSVCVIAPGINAYQVIGTIDGGNSLVSMVDNTIDMIIVDGTNNGWWVNLASDAVTPVVDSTNTFVGSNRVDFIDTFLIFHEPYGGNRWYCTESNVRTFNPLFFAAKIGYNDGIVTIAALHDCVWVFGYLTTEIWFNAGNPQFPFQRMPQSVLQYGCASAYSVVVVDNAVYWLSMDRAGSRILMRGEGYTAKRVSNFAVEQAWNAYPNISQCFCFAYQRDGHVFVVMQFQSDGTWVYDTTTGFWHRRATGNTVNGWLPWVASNWGENVILGDYSASRLYQLDDDSNDNGTPIVRERTWPHALSDQKRMSHTQFVAAMQGTYLTPDSVTLSWSDDGGWNFNAGIVQTTNNAPNGQYSWRRLGMSRDRCYRLTWSGGGQTALNGAWIEAEVAET